jgi:hypothetical protein
MAEINAFVEMVVSMAALALFIPVALLNMTTLVRYWLSEED